MSHAKDAKPGSPSPPTIIPIKKRKHILETEANMKDVYDEPSSSAGYNIPETSAEAEKRLQETPRIDEYLLSHINSLLLLDNHDEHESIRKMTNLSELLEEMFKTETFRALLGYVSEAIKSKSVTRQETALTILVSFPETRIMSHGAYRFWRDNYDWLFLRFLELFGSDNRDIQVLTFDACVKLIPLLDHWRCYREIGILVIKMITWVQQAFENKVGHIYILETRMMDLVELAKSLTHHFLRQIDPVLTCMLRIVESLDDTASTFLKCLAIRVIRILDELDAYKASSSTYRKLSNYRKHRIIEGCLQLMFVVEDLPDWYHMDGNSSEYFGFHSSFSLGVFLQLKICMYSGVFDLLTFGFDVIPPYLGSQHWQIREAAVITFGSIGVQCDPVRMILNILPAVLNIRPN